MVQSVVYAVYVQDVSRAHTALVRWSHDRDVSKFVRRVAVAVVTAPARIPLGGPTAIRLARCCCCTVRSASAYDRRLCSFLLLDGGGRTDGQTNELANNQPSAVLQRNAPRTLVRENVSPKKFKNRTRAHLSRTSLV